MPKFRMLNGFIHATWPAYPAMPGPEQALETLCLFPEGTHFEVVDDIDRCLLISAREYLNTKARADPYSEEHFHAALWQSDLRVLRDKGWITGVSSLPASADDLRRGILDFYRASGIADLIAHDLSPEAWIQVWRKTVADDEINVIADGICVSQRGWSALAGVVSQHDVDEYFMARVGPLIQIGYLDSAIREASILLELKLKALTGTTTLYGQKLVDAWVNHRKQLLAEEFVRHMRLELRTLFRFDRNEFAHNLPVISQQRCETFLRRISAVYEMLNAAERAIVEPSDVG